MELISKPATGEADSPAFELKPRILALDLGKKRIGLASATHWGLPRKGFLI